MSDTEETEVRVAAAEGAAAAVDAVHDDQERRDTEAAMAAHTEASTDAAVTAAEQAEQAAEAARMAAEAATDATETAQQASGEAQQASAETAVTRAEMDDLRESVTRGWEDMRGYLDEKFGGSQTHDDQPTEVVVTHAADTAGSNGPDAGSNGSAGDNSGGSSSDNGGTARTRRHRFGRR